MLVWFVPGWEGFAKWSEVEEASIAALITRSFDKIGEGLDYVKSHRKDERDIDLGRGPGDRQYHMIVSYIGMGFGSYDFMQMIKLAPVTGTSMDILAKMFRDELPSASTDAGEALIARMYDDGDRWSIKMIGIEENNRIQV